MNTLLPFFRILVLTFFGLFSIGFTVYGQTATPTLTTPSDNSFDNGDIAIDFTLPEAASTGTVTMTFTQAGGSADGNSPHIVTFDTPYESAANHTGSLVGADLSSSTNVISGSTSSNPLVDGAEYTVVLSYQNAAADPAATATSTVFTYDNTLPGITGSSLTHTGDSELNLTFNPDETGVLYYVATTDSDVPSAAQVLAGQDEGGNGSGTGTNLVGSSSAVGATGSQQFDIGSLTLSDAVVYYVHYLVQDGAGNNSTIESENVTADVSVPVFTSSSVTAVSNTGMSMVYNVDKTGDFYYSIHSSDQSGSITVANIKDGTGTDDIGEEGTFTISGTGSDQTEGITFSGAIAEATYYVHFIAEDGLGNQSAIQTQSFIADGTVPGITGSSLTHTGDSELNLTFNPDETGVLYYVATTDSDVPSAAQVLAGQDEGGNGSGTGTNLVGSSSAVGATGSQQFDIGSLTLSDAVVYYVHYLVQDGAGNNSTIESENVTADVSVPVFTSSSVTAVSNTGMSMVYNVDKTGDFYYSIHSSDQSGSITVANIKDGTGTDDIGEEGTFTISGTGSDQTEGITFSGAITEATYYVHFIAEDGLGNQSAIQTQSFMADNTTPSVSSVTTGDDDGDGQIDRLIVVFDDPIDGSSIDVDNTGGFDDFTNSGESYSIDAVTVDNSTQVTLTISESGSADTDATPDLDIVASQITDAAGNVVAASTETSVDGAAPVFSALLPSASSTVSTSAVGYTLSETITAGTVTFERTGGTADGSSPHTANLSGTELNGGTRAIDLLTDLPTLVDGTAYRIDFDGTDGTNAATTVSITDVTIDFPDIEISSATWNDTDNNGEIDQVIVAFNVEVHISDPSGGGDGLPSLVIADNGTPINQTNADWDDTSGPAFDSPITIDLATEIERTDITNLTVTYDQAASGYIRSRSGSIELADDDVAQSYIDNAAPVVISAAYLDVNEDGTVDRVDATFSEDITGSTYESNDWSFDTNGEGLSITGGSVSGTDVQLTVSGATSNSTSIAVTTIRYSNLNTTGSVTDGANASITGTAVNVDDAAAPMIIAAETADEDTNGLIDHLYLTFSEAVDGSEIVLADFGNIDGGGIFGIYTKSAIKIQNASFGDANDDNELVSIELTENPDANSSAWNEYDTEVSPSVVLNATSVPDVTGNTLSSLQTFIGTIDGAGPGLLEALTYDSDADGKSDKMELRFSESISDLSMIDAFGGFSVTDMLGTDVVTGFASSVANIATDTDNNDEFVTLTWTPVNTGSSGVFELDFTAGGDDVQDLSTQSNVLEDVTDFEAMDGAQPIILSATWKDTDVNGSIDQVELVFGESVSLTDGSTDDYFVIEDASNVPHTIDAAVYTFSGTTLSLNFLSDEIVGTGISGLEVYYNDGGTSSILETSGSLNEMSDAEAPKQYIDGAAPVFTAVDDNGGDNLYGIGETVILNVVVSEDVTVTADLTTLNSGFSNIAPLSGGSGAYHLSRLSNNMDEVNNASIVFTANDGVNGDVTNTDFSLPLTISVDKQAAITVSTVEGDDYVNGTEDDANITIQGTAVGVNDGASVTLELSDGTNDYTPAGVVVASEAWSHAFDITGTSLTESEITVTADVTDAAGNVATTATRNFVYDVTASIAINATLEGDNGINTGEIADVLIRGTSTGLPVGTTITLTVRDKDNANPILPAPTATVGIGGIWVSEEIDLSAYPEGTVNIQASATDDAGNSATISSTQLTIDNLASITINTVESDDIVNGAEDADVLVTGTTSDVNTVADDITVKISDGSTTVTAYADATAGSGAGWTISGEELNITTLLEGLITVSVSITDDAGNTATASKQLTYDKSATVSIATPIEGDGYINNTESDDVIVSGFTTGVENGNTVEVYFNDTGTGQVGPINATVASNAWSIAATDISTLAVGTITITADVSDNAGNAATQATQSAELDKSVALAIVTFEANVSAAESGAIDVSGTTDAEVGQIVEVTFSDVGDANSITKNATVVAGTPNIWALTDVNVSGLNDGQIDIDASVSDVSGNTNTANVNFDLDKTATIAITTSPSIEGDAVVNATESTDVVVSGTTTEVEDGNTVTVTFSDGTNSFDETVNVNANAWSVTANFSTSALVEGTINITANVSDDAGNAASEASTAVSYDKTATVSISTTISTDNYINSSEDGALVISGTTGNVETGQTVSITYDDANVGTAQVTSSAVVISNAWTSTDADISGLDEGTITINVSVSDQAGNNATDAHSTAVLDQSGDLQISSPSTVAEKTINNSEVASFMISGTATDIENGRTVTITLTDGTNTITETPTVLSEAWSATGIDLSTLDEGGVDVSVSVSDVAGNSYSATTALTIDKSISLAITTPIESDDVVSLSESETVVVSGTTSDVESGRTVTVTFDDGTNPVVTALPNISGSAWSTGDVDISGLDEGTITVTASVSDVAGNSTSDNETVTLDKSANITVGTPIEIDDVVNGAEDQDVVVSGTVTGIEDGRTVSLSFDDTNPATTAVSASATIASGAWTSSAADISSLQDGTITISITASDAAGNSFTTSVDVELDNQNPSVSFSDALSDPENGDPFDVVATFNEALTAAPVIGDFTVTNGVVASVTAGPGTNKYTLSINPTDAFDGNVLISLNAATVTDVAGNTNDASADYSIDFDSIEPTIQSANTVSGAVSITLTLNENISIDTNEPSEFTVTDEAGTSYAVTGVSASSEKLTLTVASYLNSIGDLTVAYAKSSSVYEDVASNALQSTSVVIERDMTGEVTIVENSTGVVGDNDDDVALYRSTTDPSASVPLTIKPSIVGSTITIYRDASLTDDVYQATAVPSTGISPTVGDFMSEDITDWTGSDDNGVYTFYITETSVNGVSSRGPSIVYSLAFLDDVTNSEGQSVFAGENNVGTELSVVHPSGQNVSFNGNGLSGFESTAGTASIDFIPSVASGGTHTIDINWENVTSGVDATFEEVLEFTVNETINVFELGQSTNLCKTDTEAELQVIFNPSGIDVNGTDTANPDFYGLEVYYIKDGSIDTSIGAVGGVSSSTGGNIASTLLSYDGASSSGGDNRPSIVAGTPSYSNGEWRLNPSSFTNSSTEVDTLRFVYIVSADDGSSRSVAAEKDIYLYPDPTLSMEGVDAYYCEDDESEITVQVDVDVYTGSPANGVSTVNNGFWIIKYTDSGRSTESATYNYSSRVINGTTAHSSTNNQTFFKPVNLGGDGYYTLFYESAGITPGGCTSSASADFEVLSTPELPVLLNDLSGIGGLDSDDAYYLQYNAGDTISDFRAKVTGDKVAWYNNPDKSGEISSVTGTDGYTLDSLTLFNTSTPNGGISKVFYLTEYDYIDINSSGFTGCESDVRKITTVVHNTAPAPALNLSGAGSSGAALGNNQYVFEYCQDGSLSIDNIVLTNDISATRSYFFLMDEDQTDTIRITTNTITPAYLGFDGDVGSDTLVYIVHVQNDSTYLDSNAEFAGSYSDTTKVEFFSYIVPSKPDTTEFTNGRTEYYLCNGDNLGTIAAPGLDDTKYNWYTDDGTGSGPSSTLITVGSFNDVTVKESELIAEGGFSNTTAATDTTVYTYWVTQTTNVNQTSGYSGCESEPVKVTITVFPDPAAPVLVATANDQDATDDMELSVCEGDLNALSISFTGSPNAEFLWYLLDGSMNKPTNPRYRTSSNTVTGSQLGISDATQASDGSIYFLVSQLIDTVKVGSEFIHDGCETLEADMVTVKINVFDVPSKPVEASSAITDFYYCTGATVSDLRVTGEDISGELFFWYENLSDIGVASARIDTTDNDATTATILDAVPTSVLGLDGSPSAGDYTFYVTQAQDINNPHFTGCESEPLTISIHILSNPAAPVLNLTSVALCDNGASTIVPNFQVLNSAGGTYNWIQEDVNSINDDFDGADVYRSEKSLSNVFTPLYANMRVANVNTDQNHYLVSQLTNENINSSGFAGCESSYTSFEVVVNDIPTTPVVAGTDADGNFSYCSGETITTLVIENTSDYNGATYSWYSNTGLTALISSSQSTDGSEILADDHPSFPTIDDNTDVDLNYFIIATEDGCKSSEYDTDLRTELTLSVNPLPALSLNIPNIESGSRSEAGEYCVSTDEVELIGVIGLNPANSGVFSLSTDNTAITNYNDGTAGFLPGVAHFATDDNGVIGVEEGGSSTTHTVTFTYTDPGTGCTNDVSEMVVVNPLTELSLSSVQTTGFDSSSEFAICDSFGDFIVDGTAVDIGGDDGKFFVNDIIIPNLSGSISKATFEPSRWGNHDTEGIKVTSTGVSAEYVLRYEYADQRGCSNSVEKVITLYDQPEVEFIVDGGCVNPSIDFSASVSTNSRYDEGELSYYWAWETEGGADVPLYDEYNETDEGQNVSKKFELVGVRNAQFVAKLYADYTNFVTASSMDYCRSELSTAQVDVKISPTVAFVWESVTAGQPTTFVIDELLLDNADIDRIGLRFESGADTVWTDATFSNEANFTPVEHQYDTPGNYEVSVTLATDANCATTLTRDVNILPKIKVTPDQPYIETFESGNFDPDEDGWYAETLKDNALLINDSTGLLALREKSWVWKSVDFDGIIGSDPQKPTTSGPYIWSTLYTRDDASVGYFGAEDSWLYSPSFDISEMEKPMVSFNVLYQFEDSKDGVAIQYSVDDGTSWKVLGYNDGGVNGIKSGLEWYNWDNVGSDPGQQQEPQNNNTLTSTGWSGAADQLTWASARHSLDGIEGDLTNVRFRFAIASTAVTGSSTKPFGFAFDDFSIQERSKNVLVEQFYSVSNDEGADDYNTATASLDSEISDVLISAGLSEDQLGIAYHLSFDTDVKDPFYVLNTSDPGARRSWYNVDAVTSFLDGNEGSDVFENGNPNQKNLLTWTTNDLILSSLGNPGFTIDIEGDASASENEVQGAITFTVNTPEGIAEDEELIAYVAIIEQKVVKSIGGVEEHRNVLRKLLPDASGQYIKLSTNLGMNEVLPIGSPTDADGDVSTLNVQWDLSNIADDDQLAAIVFIQNRQTKEVYQSEIVKAGSSVAGATFVSGKASASNGVLGTGEEVSYLDFNMYPNPSDQEISVKFTSEMNEGLEWVVFDQTGRVFEKGQVQLGADTFRLKTSDFPSGIYFLSIKGELHQFDYKKFMVHH
ncbi:T9SS type A sorting domain-containing protein [Reichenbachiella agariperforans]|uniref:T9SS type A sorting domain-containing protein n=1 Tax=Reichenbachiella agariperforans TaxID=156994 RepID=UPI001C08DABD|nr:T9SS type A sorting domain-containing protein [Reichenbachiella agariperforans]MBU2912486.1 T9SS type A sorting domain-containing protein [Reichenbachiella agariperforans]